VPNASVTRVEAETIATWLTPQEGFVGQIREKRLLQAVILVASLVPVVAGGYGALGGLAVSGADPATSSHLHYLSGLLFAIGLAFAWCALRIESRTIEIRLLTLLVVVGDIARLWCTADTGLTPISLFALVMELVVTPLLCLWQGRISARAP
jgi:hypothetical protein